MSPSPSADISTEVIKQTNNGKDVIAQLVRIASDGALPPSERLYALKLLLKYGWGE